MTTSTGTILYKTEPMVTRALAAEVRHDAVGLTALLERKLGLGKGELGTVTDVSCEAVERLDVQVTFDTGTTVGLEGKVDHEITDDQLNREAGAVDHLVLIVLDSTDADQHTDQVGAVLTWKETLDTFQGPRITLHDVENIPATKVRAERLLRALDFTLPDGWRVETSRGGRGMPSITVWSPQLSDGREIRGQIQVSGAAMPEDLDDVTWEFHVGISTKPDTDFPSPKDTKTEPSWITHLKKLDDEILNGHMDNYGIRRNQAGHSKSTPNKLPLVKKYLEDRQWLGTGYCDWALGPKSEIVSNDELDDLAARAQKLFQNWYEAAQ